MNGIYKGKFKGKNFIVLFIMTSFLYQFVTPFIPRGDYSVILYFVIQFLIFLLSSGTHYRVDHDGIFVFHWYSKEKLLLKWQDLLDYKETEARIFTSLMDAVVFFLLFRWLTLLFISAKRRTLTIVHGEYQEIRIQERYMKKYDEFVERIAAVDRENHRESP